MRYQSTNLSIWLSINRAFGFSYCNEERLAAIQCGPFVLEIAY